MKKHEKAGHMNRLGEATALFSMHTRAVAILSKLHLDQAALQRKRHQQSRLQPLWPKTWIAQHLLLQLSFGGRVAS
jgi:hypothetical protein